jgi:hypothetical protein
LNSPAGAEPWPVPVVLVGQRDETVLTAAARSNIKASLLLEGEDESAAIAKNVVARMDHGKDLIVVSTPQSGWFRCAGERGPGIAMFLGLARWASKRPSGPSFLFVSTSGHELGGLGMLAFLKELAPPPEQVLGWIHLGAHRHLRLGRNGERLKAAPGAGFKAIADEQPRSCSAADDYFAGLSGLTPNVDRAVGEYEFMLQWLSRVRNCSGASVSSHTSGQPRDDRT